MNRVDAGGQPRRRCGLKDMHSFWALAFDLQQFSIALIGPRQFNVVIITDDANGSRNGAHGKLTSSRQATSSRRAVSKLA